MAHTPALSLDFDLRAFERPRIVPSAEAALSTEPRSITTTRNPRSAGGLNDFHSRATTGGRTQPPPTAPTFRATGSRWEHKFDTDPSVEEIRRNFPTRHPVRWVR